MFVDNLYDVYKSSGKCQKNLGRLGAKLSIMFRTNKNSMYLSFEVKHLVTRKAVLS